MLSDDHLDTLASADNIVGALWALGKFEPARQLGEDTLARYRSVLGDDHQYRRARQLGEDSLTRCRRVLGDDHPLTLISAQGLAATLPGLGRYEQARQLSEAPSPAAVLTC